MKFILLAIICLILGYGASLFFPAKEIGLSALQEEANKLKGVTAPAADKNVVSNPVSKTYPANSFLIESDFLSVPGTVKPLGFRVGVPVDTSAADSLIKTLKPTLPAAKSRYLTANDRQSVVVIGGKFDDQAEASKALRKIQPKIKERLQIIYLPPCVVENKPDKEGFICGPPAPPKPASSPAPTT